MMRAVLLQPCLSSQGLPCRFFRPPAVCQTYPRLRGITLAAVILLLSGCAEKVVTIPGPEVVRLVPAKVDPRLLSCMEVDPPTADAIPEGTSDPMVAAILGTWAQRYKMAWDDCRQKLDAIRETQE